MDLRPAWTAEARLLSGDGQISTLPTAREDSYPSRSWDDRRIRAAVVSWLLGRGTAVEVIGAEIVGPLDLTGAELVAGLTLRRCLIGDAMVLTRTQLPRLDLGGSFIAGLDASGLTCDTVRIDDAAVCGKVTLSAAQLGHLSFSGTLLTARERSDLVLDGNVLTTTRSVDFNGGFEAQGGLRFIGASIGGQFNFRNAVLHGRLSLHEATTGRALYLRQGLFHGSVNLSDARIGGRLDAKDATVVPGTPTALNMNGTTVERALQLTGAVVKGGVVIRNALIRGNLRLSQASLRASSTTIPGDLASTVAAEATLSDQRTADPEAHVAVREAEIAARVWERPQGGRTPSSREAFTDDQWEPFALRISNTQIGGGLVCQAASIWGPMDTKSSSIGGSLDLRWSLLRNAGASALSIADCGIGGSLRLREMTAVEGTIDLVRTRMSALEDDPEGWRLAKEYRLRGATYSSISWDGPWSLKARIDWLRGQSEYSSQPFEQLATVLLAGGRRHQAWRVLEAEHDARLAAGDMPWWRRAAGRISGALLGHGYRPEKALYALAALSILLAPVYELAWREGAVTAASADAAVEGRCTDEGDCFGPWTYSLANSVPFVDLGLRDAWRLDAREGPYAGINDVHIAAAWLLATAGVAGLTRRAVKT